MRIRNLAYGFYKAGVASLHPILEDDENGQKKPETMVAKVKTDSTLSACRVVQEGRAHDCTIARVEEGLAEGSAVWAADADVFHKSRRKRAQSFAARGAGAREETAFGKSSER